MRQYHCDIKRKFSTDLEIIFVTVQLHVHLANFVSLLNLDSFQTFSLSSLLPIYTRKLKQTEVQRDFKFHFRTSTLVCNLQELKTVCILKCFNSRMIHRGSV